MKKLFVILIMVLSIFDMSLTSAAFEENIMENADLSKIKKLAIALPDFYKVDEKEPTREELTEKIFNAGNVSNLEIISYDEIVKSIRRDTGIIVDSLEALEAEKLFASNISKYADAYLVVTIANNSNKPWLFFYIYDSTNSDLLYTYSVQSSSIGKNTKDYIKAAEDFFKKFNETSVKNSKSESKKIIKSDTDSSKSKEKKSTYKIGKIAENKTSKK